LGIALLLLLKNITFKRVWYNGEWVYQNSRNN
jgi:hypothetical protein